MAIVLTTFYFFFSTVSSLKIQFSRRVLLSRKKGFPQTNKMNALLSRWLFQSISDITFFAAQTQRTRDRCSTGRQYPGGHGLYDSILYCIFGKKVIILQLIVNNQQILWQKIFPNLLPSKIVDE